MELDERNLFRESTTHLETTILPVTLVDSNKHSSHVRKQAPIVVPVPGAMYTLS